ncbi:MAG: glycosyltransferase [Candidatus Cloacimonetes bacterium]|nr:glycosyltransferase [Candidatus Cloacimonadota bacterium]
MRKNLCSIIIPVFNRKNEVVGCINSLLNSTYKYLEFIIIDNASSDGTYELLKNKFSKDRKFKIIRMKENKGAVGGRNEGIKHAKGEYLLFVDSDNIVDKYCIEKLINLAKKREDIGFVGPKMYYYKDKKRIWYAGAKINLITSKTTYIGINKVDKGQFNKIKEVEHIPNLWLVKREVIDKIGGLDEIYVMTYGESDWPMRAKEAGFKIMFCPSAITYHDVPPPKERKGLRKSIGFDNKYRIYYVARNRTIFMKKFSKLPHFLIYLFIFLPIITLIYLFNLIKYFRFDLIPSFIKGTFDGFFQGEKKIIYKHLQQIKKEVEEELDRETFLDLDSKYYEYSFINDVNNIIKTTPKELKILEVGCGRGVLAALLSSLGYLKIDAIDVKYTEKIQTGTLHFDNLFSERLKKNSRLTKREKIWRKLNKSYGVNYKYYSKKFPFPDNFYDCVVAYAVIEHVEDKYLNNFLNEVRRVLKKDGIFWIFKCPNKFSYVEYIARKLHIPCHDKLYSKNELINLLNKHQFSLISIKKTDFIPSFFPWNQKIYNKLFLIGLILEKILRLTLLELFGHHWMCKVKNKKT